MKLELELKIIRWMLVVIMIGTGAWFGMSEYLAFVDSTKSTVLGTKIVVSGFGEIKLYNPEKINLFSTNIYKNSQLGYQISKPNSDWEIHSVLDELSLDELKFLETKGFLDGVYIEQDHDRRFMLTVFNTQKENFFLHEYVKEQIYQTKIPDIIIPFEQVSPENDWAIFAMKLPDKEKYGEQILFLKEGRLYMLQYSGNSPQIINSEQKNDFQFIMDSFEVI